MIMNRGELNSLLSQIPQTDKATQAIAQARLDSLLKPPGSLGKLEEMAARMAAISGQLYYNLDKRCVIIMASDNGVVEEGVASAPQVVTMAQTLNFGLGITGVSVLARRFNTDLMVIDVGVNADIDDSKVINRKIRKSTGNIARERAMTETQALRAVEVGIEAATEAVNQGYQAIGIGEMGIGNTTTSSAVLCGLLGWRGDQVADSVGRGAGLTDEGFARKVEVISRALNLHEPDSTDPIDVLGKVGGFDLAAMAGAYIGAALNQVPVVIDGFISVVAALCAVRLNPVVREYLFASHQAFERGYAIAVQEIGVSAALNLNMRLGEGSGCPLLFALMDAAIDVIRDMGSLEAGLVGEEYIETVHGESVF